MKMFSASEDHWVNHKDESIDVKSYTLKEAVKENKMYNEFLKFMDYDKEFEQWKKDIGQWL